MLQIVVPRVEENDFWDEKKEQFVYVPPQREQTLQLEHSLLSLSKWESTWCKPFFSKEEKTNEEVIDYVKCMTITNNIDASVYYRLTDANIKAINDYVAAPMTATTVNNPTNRNRGRREIITSELIYYWMIAFNIPFECQKWHINRLLTLIQVCEAKNAPSTKMNKRDLASKYASLNAARKKKYGTKG